MRKSRREIWARRNGKLKFEKWKEKRERKTEKVKKDKRKENGRRNEKRGHRDKVNENNNSMKEMECYDTN